MISRLLAGAAIFIMVMTSTVSALKTVNSAGLFSDVDYDNKNYTAINYLKNDGVVKGYDDGSYKPKNKINRAEFLKIVMEASNEKAEGKDCYKDVKDEWYSGYVCAATRLGVVNGYNDGYFRPEQEINFVEAAKIITNTLKLEVKDDSENWYKKYVAALENDDAIPNTINSFDHRVTRGEMAEMVWRIKAKPGYVKSISYQNIEGKMMAAETGGKLQKFESCGELKDYLEDNSKLQPVYKMGDMMMIEEDSGDSEDSADDTVSAVPTVAVSEAASEGLGSAAGEYSSTNVQVEGVDEADIVKNDNKYVYVLKGNTIRIVDAYPPDLMKEVSKVQFDDQEFYPSDMYVDGDRLVVIGYTYDSLWNRPYVGEPKNPDKMPIIADEFYYGGITRMYVFDIKDKSKVEKIRELSYEGNYSSSRKVGSMVYLVVNKPEFIYTIPENWSAHEIVPLYLDSAESEKVNKVASCGDILYLPGSESTNYIVVAGVPIDDPQAPAVDEVVLGSSGDIYSSKENLYVAEQKYDWFYDDDNDEEQTIVHKFNLGRTDVKYFGKSDVPGHILNQFSMDEYKGNFRIATTIGDVWNSENPSQNNVYILDENLKHVGNIEGIAPGEKIYSVRFMGDRAYMVTFKKVDPFFVIDVADPANPRILGKLKIPGYSDYLHPYDENHIIGFGKEAVDPTELEKEGWNSGSFDFAWYQGMKIAMFDVTDVSNPVEMFKAQIGDRGTDSPLLSDHKALLFDKNKGLMAFPVTVAEIPEAKKNDPNKAGNEYGDYVYQGTYVYSVSLDKGFEFKGRITHYDENEIKDKSGYYWYGDKDISRALYLGDYLYTVSQAMLKANNIEDLMEVKSLKLEE